MEGILATITEFFSFIGDIIKQFLGFFGGLVPSKPDDDAAAEEE